MGVKGMNHFTVLTDDLPKTTEFYTELLGLTVGYRPLEDLGVWLYAGGEEAVLHVMADRPLPADRAGVLDHMAFTGSDLPGIIEKLRQRSLKFELRRQKKSRIWQLFFHDPNGAKVELDFSADEPVPPGISDH
jgi:catechol 2,3-dioxygenase-like lactoylglutathione lyase family enzyme